MVVDLLSLSIPFQLARQLYDSIRTKGSSTPAISANVTRPPLAKDLVLQIYATVLAAAIYSVALFIAYQSFLAKTLVVHFAGLATVEPAHKATFLSLLPIGIIFGLACDAFIFIPAASSTATSNEDDSGHFDPVTASLGETVRYNLWGWNSRTKVVLRRTALLALLVVPATIYLQSAYALQGVDARGAAAWAAVWAAAAGAAGLGLGFVVGGA